MTILKVILITMLLLILAFSGVIIKLAFTKESRKPKSNGFNFTHESECGCRNDSCCKQV